MIVSLNRERKFKPSELPATIAEFPMAVKQVEVFIAQICPYMLAIGHDAVTSYVLADKKAYGQNVAASSIKFFECDDPY